MACCAPGGRAGANRRAAGAGARARVHARAHAARGRLDGRRGAVQGAPPSSCPKPLKLNHPERMPEHTLHAAAWMGGAARCCPRWPATLLPYTPKP